MATLYTICGVPETPDDLNTIQLIPSIYSYFKLLHYVLQVISVFFFFELTWEILRSLECTLRLAAVPSVEFQVQAMTCCEGNILGVQTHSLTCGLLPIVLLSTYMSKELQQYCIESKMTESFN